jgi:glycosyltransferase involved in cell wall biosynthesis
MSRYCCELLMERHGPLRDRVVVSPPGVDAERFRPGTIRPAAVPVLLTVRRLEARMGIDSLLRAAARLRAGGRKFRLIVAGAGPERHALEQLAHALNLGTCVRFAGFVPEAELADLYRSADLFVLPSRALEGFGLATLEAMASGLPVLATPIGASPEILGPVDPRLLLADAGPDAITRGIDALLATPDSLRPLGTACRAAAQRYRWATLTTALERAALTSL